MKVNKQLLDEIIKVRGIKQSHIIDKLGISSTAWYKKKDGIIPFRIAEIYVICDLLRLTDSEKNEIFFAE